MEFYGIIITQDNEHIAVVKNKSYSGWSTPEAAQKATHWYANGIDHVKYEFITSSYGYYKFRDENNARIAYWSLK